MILAKQLGMIPSWQFNEQWEQNPNFNRHVLYPPGMTQMTVQPVGPNYSPIEEAVVGPAGTAGFGRTVRQGITEYGLPATGSIQRLRQRVSEGCCDDCSCPGCPSGFCPSSAVRRYQSATAMRGFGSPLDFFESPAWAHRKWIVIGGVALLGLAALGGITAILR